MECSDGGASITARITVTVLPEGSEDNFRRGDVDASGRVNITDAIAILTWLFLGGDTPSCVDAADTDDGGAVDLSDAVRILSWLFAGASAPAEPGPTDCGSDPAPDTLPDCEFPACP